MSVNWRQVMLLLRNALRMDFRVRGAGRERRWRVAQPFAMNLLFYVLMGAFLGSALSGSGVPLHARATLVYAVAGLLLVLNLMIEYQEVLLAPADGDILGWRPIASRTLYLARVLHVIVYVGLLTLALTIVPCATLGGSGGGAGWLARIAFLAGAFASALLATGLLLLVHGLLLGRLSPDRFQDVLANVQLLVMLAMVLGYQLLTPEILGMTLGEHSRWNDWLVLSPPAWFAALPALAAGHRDPRLGMALAAGVLAFAVVWGVAVRRLAPGYQMQIEGVQVAAGIPGRTATRLPAWQQMAGGWLGQQPLRRLGFDFFLAQLRGDRKIRVALMPLFALPVGLLLAALLLGGGSDPYSPLTGTAGWLRKLEPDAALEARTRGQIGLFTAVYLMSSMAMSMSRSLGRSNDWRASWVFHAAPLRRYDQFYSGVLWGVFAALLLPCILVVGALLLVAWRNPTHVAAHLALPVGLALLAMPLAHVVDFTPPFCDEPVRHARSREMVLSLLVAVPLIAMASLQWVLRDRPGLLLLGGLALIALAAALGALLVRRLRNVFRFRAFEG